MAAGLGASGHASRWYAAKALDGGMSVVPRKTWGLTASGPAAAAAAAGAIGRWPGPPGVALRGSCIRMGMFGQLSSMVAEATMPLGAGVSGGFARVLVTIGLTRNAASRGACILGSRCGGGRVG